MIEFWSAIDAAETHGQVDASSCSGPNRRRFFLPCDCSPVRWSVRIGDWSRREKESIRPLGPYPRSTVLPPRGYLWRVRNKNKYEIILPTDNGLYQMVIMCTLIQADTTRYTYIRNLYWVLSIKHNYSSGLFWKRLDSIFRRHQVNG